MNKVLDNGYVRLVETWGSDERIIEAARMSTGKGFQGWGTPEKPGDEKLLAFLWNNKHTSPFEQAGFSIEVQAPLMVFREWHRHRTQCLTGDTKIACVSPRGTTYFKAIEEIFSLKYGGVVDNAPVLHKNGFSKAGTAVSRKARRKDPWRTRILPNCQERTLRVLNEKTLEFTTAKMADVWESGVKDVYEITTEAGYKLKASAEHPFFTANCGECSWKKTKELNKTDYLARMGKISLMERPIPPALRQGIGVWTSMMRSRLIQTGQAQCNICKGIFDADFIEIDHTIPIRDNLKLALDESNLQTLCVTCHRNKTNTEQHGREGMTGRGVRWDRVVSVEFIGSEMTYDIEVDGPHHNYVANYLVVHNSYNEFSGRYAQMPDVHYLPDPERVKAQSKKNKQGTGVEELPPEVVAEFLERIATEQRMIYATYEWALSKGIAREIARINTPISRYSKMVASANLLNWLKFLSLRLPENAQWEIRQYANVVAKTVEEKFPRTWALFNVGRA